MTNADRIRAMSDEEMTAWVCGQIKCEYCGFASASGCTLHDWLQQPAEEDNNG